MGTGKTCTVLALIHWRNRRLEKRHEQAVQDKVTLSPPIEFLPTLIVVPPAVVLQWLKDFQLTCNGLYQVAV